MRILLLALLATGCAHQQYNENLQFDDTRCDVRHLDKTLQEDCEAQGISLKGVIKTWSAGETLHSADLNSNFSHIHSLMVGGHGARLVDSDVSASANIALSKIAITPALVPKAWAEVAAVCASPCAETIAAGSGVSGIQHTAVGAWTVTWTSSRADILYGVLVTSAFSGNNLCSRAAITTTTANITCYTANTAVAADPTSFTLLMFDNL